jgi:hypothetical protein
MQRFFFACCKEFRKFPQGLYPNRQIIYLPNFEKMKSLISSRVSNQLKGILTRSVLLFLITCVPLLSSAQFERKISINFSGGVFKTFGDKGYPSSAAWEGSEVPYLMPNYAIGTSWEGGLQYNFSRHLSVGINLGYLRSQYWWFDAYDEANDDYYSYLGFHVYDPVSGEIEEESANYLTLHNRHLGLSAKYYFLPAKKFKPYALTEVNLNILDAEYIDNQYDVYERLGRLDEYEFEYNTSFELFTAYSCVGFLAGGGIAYTLNENIGFFFETAYWFIFLNWEEYMEPVELSNFNAFKFQLGVRFSFIKSKQL